MSSALRVISAVLLLAALTSCGTTPVQEDRYYRPAVSLPTTGRAPLPVRIVVEPFEVHGLYSDRPLVYVDVTGAYQQSNHNNWVESPSIMLASGLLDTLHAAYGEESAFLPDARVTGDLTVRTRVRRFERLSHNTPVQALLSLEIIVTARGGKLVGTVDFEETAAAGTTIPDYVRTQSELLGKAYAKLLALLDERAAALPSAP